MKITTGTHPLATLLNSNFGRKLQLGYFKNPFFIDYKLNKKDVLLRRLKGDDEVELPIKTVIIFNCPISDIDIVEKKICYKPFIFRRLYSKEYISQGIPQRVILIPDEVYINRLV